MKEYAGEQAIGQLEKIKGGYFYLTIEADIINQFAQTAYPFGVSFRRHNQLSMWFKSPWRWQFFYHHCG